MSRLIHTSQWPRWVRLTVTIGSAMVLLLSPSLLAIGYSVLAGRVSDTARTAYVEACEGNNEVRHQVVDLTSSLLDRSKKSAAATISSPSASPRQKLVAQQNLDSGKEITAQIARSLTPTPCVYPPVSTSTTKGR